MKLKKFKPPKINLRSAIAVGLIIVVCAALLGYRLGSLTPGMSESEVLFVESASSIAEVLQQPLFLLQKIPLALLNTFDLATILSTRAVTAVFALASAVMFYFIIKQWHTRRIAVIVSLLFVSSSWFLQLGRIASPEIMYVFMPLLLLLLAFRFNTHERKLTGGLLVVAAALSLYIPGLVWLVIALKFLFIKRLIKLYKKMSILMRIGIIAGVLFLLSPLIYAIVKDWQIVLDIFAIPSSFEPIEWLKRLALIPIFLTAQGPFMPMYNLGRLPLLDVFSVVMVVLGSYWYYFRISLLRTKVLLVMGGVSALLIAFGGIMFIPMLLPLVFIVIAAGLSLLLQQWFTVFPLNPLARVVGAVLITAAILIVGTYHMQRYFVAWSGSQATHRLFVNQLD